MKLLNRKYLIIGVSVVVSMLLIVLIIVLIRRNRAVSLTIPVDNGQTTITQDQLNILNNYAERLYNDMHGLNVVSRDEDIYNIISTLNDTMLAALYNIYNQKYGHDETLTQWLENENFSWNSFKLQGTVDSIISRLKKLEQQSNN